MFLHFNYSFYKAVRAYTVVLHVYEQFEIDYMRNKTFLSFILIISKTTSSTFTKCCCFNSVARWYYLYNIVRTHPWLQSRTLFGSLNNAQFYEVLGAKETHFVSERASADSLSHVKIIYEAARSSYTFTDSLVII